jgi:tetratricopeptide (TPR) repeat protein
MLQPALSQSKGGTTTPPTGGGSLPGSTGSVPGGTTGTGSSTTSIPTRTTPSTTTSPNSNTNTQPTMVQPIFLNGRVMTDDGSPLPEPAVIERVCNGVPRAEGYTDSRGYFGIELGGANKAMPDAAEYGGFDGLGSGLSQQSQSSSSFGGMGLSGNRFMSCDLRAKLPGFHSQTVSLANRRALDDPNVGTIFLHRMGTVEGRTISAVSLAAPKDAKKAYEKGLDSAKKRKLDDAAKNFEKAVELYPKYATAWYELGRLQAAGGKLEAAHQSFDAALQADPKFLNPYLQLSLLALQAQKWQELADITDRTVKLDPFDYPQVFLYNSVANYNLKNIDAAEKSAREAEKLDTQHQFPKVSHLLGIILAQRRDFSGAAEQLRSYLKLAPGASDAATVRSQLTEIEKLAGPAAAAKQQPEK